MPAKFTSGQYKQMAEIIKDMKPDSSGSSLDGIDTIPMLYWKEYVRGFCHGLCKLNPKVKPSLFYRVCGLEEET